ncbi:MAG: hypothetical protein U0271_23745 [Polyangiaceae bacterium]
MDPITRIEAALDRLRAAVRKAKIAPAAPPERVAQLVEEAGDLPLELAGYFRVCNGVRLPAPSEPLGELFSVEQILDLDSPGFFAVGGDATGDLDVVAARFEVGSGAVLSWDHESGELEVRASSLSAHIDVWVERAIHLARPITKRPFTALKALFDPHAERALLERFDPEVLELRRDKAFRSQFETLSIERVDRAGVVPVRLGIDPISKQQITHPAPPRRRRKWQAPTRD